MAPKENKLLYVIDLPTISSHKVEKYKEIERFKLTVWIAKVFSSFVLVVSTIILSAYLYVGVTTHKFIDLSAVAAVLNGFFEVLKVIVGS